MSHIKNWQGNYGNGDSTLFGNARHKNIQLDKTVHLSTDSSVHLPFSKDPNRMQAAKNVLGTTLQSCSLDPPTGFFRDGCCRSGADDLGLHLVCAEMTSDFLEFSRDSGNDLITPVPAFRFPGLKPGDRWCLCVKRWKEAFEAGIAPKIVLESTHISTLEFVDLEDLQAHSVPI